MGLNSDRAYLIQWQIPCHKMGGILESGENGGGRAL